MIQSSLFDIISPKKEDFLTPRRKMHPDIELKAIDRTVTGALPNQLNNGLNGLVKGTDYSDRTGRRINIKSIQIRAQIYPNTGTSSGTAIGNTVRFFLVVDKQSNGTLPNLSDIFNTDSTAAFTEPNIYSQRILNYRERFEVLIDELIPFDGYTVTAGVTTPLGGWSGPRYYQKYLKCHIPVTFNDVNSGGYADIQTNAIFFAMIAGKRAFHATNSSTPKFDFTTRFRFEDA